MPRLDDAGVHGTDRDLVDAITLHAQEGVVVYRRAGCHLPRRPRLAAETSPPARRHVAATDADRDRLTARHRGRMQRAASAMRTERSPRARDISRPVRAFRRAVAHFVRHAQLEHQYPRSDRHRSADDRWRGARYTGHDPQAEQPPACRSQTGGTRTPFLGRHAQPPHRERAIHPVCVIPPAPGHLTVLLRGRRRRGTSPQDTAAHRHRAAARLPGARTQGEARAGAAGA